MAKKVETDEEKKARETVEEIATNIAKLARSVTAILDGRLKKKAIVVLLAQSAQMPQWQVERVLEAVQALETTWIK